MTLKAWAKYAHKKTEAMKAAAENQMEYFSSENSDQDEYEENDQTNDLKKSSEETDEEIEAENDKIIEEEDLEYEQSPMKGGAHTRDTPVGFQDVQDKCLFENISFVQSEIKDDEQREEIKNLEPIKINVKKVEDEGQVVASRSGPKRSFSVDEGEEIKSQNIINYSINNNYVINNNYYFNNQSGSSSGDVRHEVNVELHREVQINKITLKKIE